MKKKKVTAPLTYNPGKGRPKEYLAYLNYQEMQALKRLNGNNQERGPMGLPSFPPDDARGSSSKASSKSSGSKNSTGSKGSGTSTSWGGSSTKGSGTSTSKNTGTGSKGSGTSTGWGGPSKANAAGKDTGAGRSGGGAGPRSGVSGTRSPTSGSTTGSGKGPSMSKDTGGKSPAPRSGLEGSRSPTSGSRLSSSGQKPGGIADLGGGKRASGDTPGSKIKGAIAAVKNPVNYTTAPRYNQPQAQRMANPTAIPSMERTSAERMNMAEAARRREATAAALTARNGPFGPTSYTGTYNPATNRYDARPVGAKTSVPGSVGMDPSIAGRLSKANQNYKTVTGPGGMVSRTYSDPDINGPTLGETISGYASRVADAVFGPDTQKMAQQYTDSFTDFGNRFAKAMDTMKPQVSVNQDYQRFSEAMAPYTTGNIAVRNAMTVDKNINMADEYDRAAAEQGLLSANEARKIGASSSTKPKQIVDRVAPSQAVRSPSLEGARPYDIKVTAPPASGIDLRAPAKTRGLSVEPTGYAQPGERELSVETVPEAGIAGLTGEAAKKAAKEYGIPASVYNSPGFAEDVNRLGLTGAVQKNLSATDMAKLHARAYGEQYLTPAEKRQAAVIGGIKRGVTIAADVAAPVPVGPAVRQYEKLTGVETPKEFLSRPSYEQSYLRDVARAENIRMGRDPLGRTSYTTADGQTVQRTGPSFGQGGDRGGIASLTVPTRTVAPTPTESTTGTGSGNDSGGGRPYIHFQWDLGLNIPAPTDPNYADYQKYLANRAASAAALESA